MRWKASPGGMMIDLTYCMLSCSALPHRPTLSDSSEIIVTVWNELVCQTLVTRRKSMCIYWNPDTSALEKTLSKIRTQKQMSTMTCQRPISLLLDTSWLLEPLRLLASLFLSEVHNMIVHYFSINYYYRSCLHTNQRPACQPKAKVWNQFVSSQTLLSRHRGEVSNSC